MCVPLRKDVYREGQTDSLLACNVCRSIGRFAPWGFGPDQTFHHGLEICRPTTYIHVVQKFGSTDFETLPFWNPWSGGCRRKGGLKFRTASFSMPIAVVVVRSHTDDPTVVVLSDRRPVQPHFQNPFYVSWFEVGCSVIVVHAAT